MRERDETRLLQRVRDLRALLEGAPVEGVHARLQALEREASEMGLDLCAFAREHEPAFLPYYYLLEGSHACDDPAVPLWVREQVRAHYGVN